MNSANRMQTITASLVPHASTTTAKTTTTTARTRGRGFAAALVATALTAALLGACTEPTTDDSNGATRRDASALFDVDPDAAAAATATMCEAASSCGACVAMGPCGWCSRTSSCLAGNAAGSDDGTCTETDWDFFGDRCEGAGDGGVAPSDPCASATQCGTCTLRDSCGWCASSSRCLQGDESGSNDGTCAGSGWDYLGDHCGPTTPPPPDDAGSGSSGDSGSGSSDPCAAATSCGTCTAMSSCGWCTGLGRCASGSSTGSRDGACTGSGWDWTGTTCGR